MDRRPTIIDVAQDAGVSKSLVSRALRGEHGVSATTRERILRTADELGYRSNQWARSLKRGRTDLVGVLLTDLDNTYHTDVVHGIEDAAATAGLAVVLNHGRRDARVLQGQLDSMQLLGVDGVIVVSAMLDGPTLAAAAATTPTVVVGRPPRMSAELSSVANDDARGSHLAVEHLVALGHRRIVHVLGSQRPAARSRRDAYRDRMRQMALEEHVRLVPAEATASVVAEVVGRARAAPTAVFAANDRIAAQLVGQAVDAGLRVPDDLSIVGYDNATAAQLVRPQLTTVDQPRRRMGREAMEQLAGLIRGDTRPRQLVLDPTLVVRRSSSPPGGAVRGARP